MSTWQFMVRLFTYRPDLFAVNVILWALFHLLPLAFGLLTKAVFDALTGAAAFGWNVWTLLLLLAAAGLGRAGVFHVAFRLYSEYYSMVQALLRRNLMAHLMLAAGSRILPESPSEAVTRFRDDVEDVAEYFENWIDLAGFALFGLSALAVMCAIDPLITVVACGPMFLMTWMMQRMGELIRRYRRAFREATALVTGFIGETFAAVQAVKVAGKEEAMTQRFAGLGHARRRAALKDTLMREFIDTANTNLVNVGIGAVLLLAAAQMRSGQFTVGDFALYVNVLPRLTRVLTFIGRTMAQHKRTRVAFDRMLHLLQDSPPENLVAHVPLHLTGELPPLEREPVRHWPLEVLEVKGLTFHYPGTRAGIEDVSFTVRRGEFVVITGRIGSGKTTLLRALLGLVPPQRGEVWWNGRRVEDPASFFRPPHAAYTAQVPQLFSETLRENILLGEEDQARLAQALELAVLGPDVASLERGLDTLVGTRGVKLSGGQVQRTAAARMFAREADLMVFDDLSSALDVETERKLWDALFAQRDATCLVVSHRQAALQRASRVIVLERGRIVAEGPPAELIERGALDHLFNVHETLRGRS